MIIPQRVCGLQKLKPLLAAQPMAELTGPLKQYEDALPLLQNDSRFDRVAESDRFDEAQFCCVYSCRVVCQAALLNSNACSYQSV